jgi:hypothetical protein
MPLFHGPGLAGAGSSSAPQQPLDMAPLQAALNTVAASPSASTGTSETILDTSETIVDTGASVHMFSDHGNLRALRPLSSPSHLVVGNDARLPITHTGAGQIVTTSSPLHLRNVLISPSLIKNLLSVHQLTRDN